MRSVFAVVAVAFVACTSEEPVPPEDNRPPARGDGGTGSSSSSSSGGGTDGGGPAEPITVTGKIVIYGVGAANVPVVVGGKVPVNTSSLGTFTVPDVLPPYDVAFALRTSDAQPRITVYRGLTRADPTLVALGTAGELRPNPTAATSLAGKITGGGGPPWGRTPVVAFGAPNRASGFATASATDGTFTMTGNDAPLWYGSNAVTGSLHAALVLGNAGQETAFYGRVDNVTATSAATLTRDVTLASVPVAQLTATITAPALYNDPTKTVVLGGVRFQESAGYFVRTTDVGPFPAKFVRGVPRVDGGTYQVSVGYTVAADAEATYGRATGPVSGAPDLSIALAEPPRPTQPAEGAKDVASTTPFSFSGFPGGVHRLTIFAANQPSVVVVTTETSVALPDLAPFATSLPAGVELTWRVAGFRPLTTMDDDALPALLAVQDGALPAVDKCEIAVSAARKVTLAP